MTGPNDMDGYTTLAKENDGVFLTVFPPRGKGRRMTLDDVRRELAKYKIVINNDTLLNQLAHQASGKPQKIATIKNVQQVGSVFVEITPDEMTCKITVIPPEDGKFGTLDDVRAAMAKYDVKYGVDEARLSELAQKIQTVASGSAELETIEMDVAFGTPVQQGEDARLEFLYKKDAPVEEKPAAVFEESEDGRIDYHDALHQIENIAKGTLLVRKIHPTKGVPGRTVTGKVIEAKDGKDIEIVCGKGAVFNPENKDEILADADGQVIVKDNRISVMSIYEVPGDVDFTVGNIDFVGTVNIHGDVKDGFKVFAGEDLIIQGVVEAAELKAGGKLVIAGGLSGSDRAIVSCQGDATIKYIRNARVEVGGNLTVAQAVMHSKVVVGKKCTVAGKKGVIVGGQVIAGEEVNAASMGSNFATPTEVIVGEMVGVRDELQKLENEIKTAAENLEKTKKGMLFLKDLQTKMGGNLPPEKKELLTKLTRAQFKLMADVKGLGEKKMELDRQDAEGAAERKRHAKVSCLGIIHTGVKITVNKASRQVSEELKYCTLTESDGEVKVGPFK
jgi:uncharacterized protein (DUF342 family)